MAIEVRARRPGPAVATGPATLRRVGTECVKRLIAPLVGGQQPDLVDGHAVQPPEAAPVQGDVIAPHQLAPGELAGILEFPRFGGLGLVRRLDLVVIGRD